MASWSDDDDNEDEEETEKEVVNICFMAIEDNEIILENLDDLQDNFD